MPLVEKDERTACMLQAVTADLRFPVLTFGYLEPGTHRREARKLASCRLTYSERYIPMSKISISFADS